MTSATKNAARRNGKAWKKNPGISKNAHTGRTTGGYTADTLALREAKRRAAATTPTETSTETPTRTRKGR